MPVTKTITGVTLGDYAKPSSCADDMTAYVNIYHASDGRIGALDEPFGRATGPATVTSTPGRLHWTLQAPYTMLAGHAYEFRVTVYGCPTVLRTTWQHHPDGSQVEGGPQPCQGMNYGLPVSVGHLAWRMWHSYLSEDAQPACANQTGTGNWDASFPQGWLVTVSYNGNSSYVRTVEHQTGPPIAGSICGDPQLEGHDVTEVFWKTSPDDPLRSIYVCQWTQYEPFGMQTQSGWQYAVPFKDGAEPRSSYVHLDAAGVDLNELLRQYAPMLNYDPAEDYRADSPAVLTNSYVENGPPGENHWNSLLGGTGGTIADSLPQIVVGTPQFDLGSLRAGPTYRGVSGAPDFGSVYDDDRIDAYGSSDDDYVPDAQRMHAVSTLGNQIYGRAVADGDKTWLQYWFFYYDDQVPGGLGYGNHEGDWEMIQVGLDTSSLNPSVVTLAAHKDDEAIRCPWGDISKSTINGTTAPNVFVALGTHASYPFPGEWDRGALPNDNIGPDGIESVKPNMVAGALDTGSGADWTYWPGWWGNSHGSTPQLDQDSPRGPRFQGTRWSSPAAFNNNARACPSVAPRTAARSGASSRSSGGARPHAQTREHGPWVSAHLIDSRHVRVRYHFRSLRTRRGERLYSILVTGRSTTKNAQPRTYGYRVRHLRGSVTQDLPLGKAPFTIRVAAMTRDLTIAATTTVRVRG